MVPISQCLEILNRNSKQIKYSQSDCEMLRSILYVFAEIEIDILTSESFSNNTTMLDNVRVLKKPNNANRNLPVSHQKNNN